MLYQLVVSMNLEDNKCSILLTEGRMQGDKQFT